MRFVRPLTVLLVLLIAASDAATSFAAPLYSLTDLGVLSGEESSFAEGINNTGVVVGRSGPSASFNYARAFVWTPVSGMFEPLPPPQNNSIIHSAIDVNDLDTAVGGGGGPNGFIWTQDAGRRPLPGLRVPLEEWHTGVAINDHGHVAGFVRDIGGAESFFWDGANPVVRLGHLTPPGPLLQIWTEASDINNGDTIVGRERNISATVQQAIRWTQDSGLRRLAHLPGVTNSSAEGINDLGQIVGLANDGGPKRAVKWSNSGEMQFLPASPGAQSVALDINEQGLIVGHNEFRAALWSEDGTLHELATLLDSSGAGWSLAEAKAINDIGQIVGWGTNPAGQQRAFLLTPVPEPQTITLCVVVACGAAAICLRERRADGITKQSP